MTITPLDASKMLAEARTQRSSSILVLGGSLATKAGGLQLERNIDAQPDLRGPHQMLIASSAVPFDVLQCLRRLIEASAVGLMQRNRITTAHLVTAADDLLTNVRGVS